MTQQNVKVATKIPANHFEQDTMLWYSPSADAAWYASWNGSSWDLSINGLGLKEMEVVNPDLLLIASDSFALMRYELSRKPVVEISEERFTDMLEVLPPVNWCNPGEGKGKSFMLEEIFSGEVSDIYVEWLGRYFELRDYYKLTHDLIIELVEGALNKD